MICHNLGHSNVHPWSRIVFVSLFLSFFILQLNKTGCMGLWRWGNFPTTTWPVVVFKTKRATAGFTFGSQVPSYYYSVNEIIMTAQTQPIITSWAKQRVKPIALFCFVSYHPWGEMWYGFSPLSGEATSWGKKFPMSHEWLITSDK